MTIDSETHPTQADEVHDVEALLAVLHHLADDAVDLVEDPHAGQDRPQHEDHDDAGDAQGDREQERDLHRRPRVDARDRQAHPTGGCRARRRPRGGGGSRLALTGRGSSRDRQQQAQPAAAGAGGGGAGAVRAAGWRVTGTGVVGALAEPASPSAIRRSAPFSVLRPLAEPPSAYGARRAEPEEDAGGAHRAPRVLLRCSPHDLLQSSSSTDGTASVASSATPDPAGPATETASSPS